MPSFLANRTSRSRARFNSLASVGNITAFGCTVVSITTRARSDGFIASVLVATARLSCNSALSLSSPIRWRQRVSDDRMGDELPAGGMLHGGGDAHLDPELVRPVRFALADALDLWRVQGIDLATALAALLFQHAPGQEQRPYERFPQIFIPDDAPLDVADDTAEIGLELA